MIAPHSKACVIRNYIYFLIAIYFYFRAGAYITAFFETTGNTMTMTGSF
jgi:hypothetical protein